MTPRENILREALQAIIKSAPTMEPAQPEYNSTGDAETYADSVRYSKRWCSRG